jgi:hypothetical protein
MSSWKDVEVSGGGGLFLSQTDLKEGDNRIRICSVPLAVWKGYPSDGKPSKCVTFATQKEADAYNARFDAKTEEGRKQLAKQRHYCFVIDRESGTPRVFDMGASITGQLRDLANDADYGFEDIPSYDVKVKKSGKGMETEYKVLPCPMSELTDDEKAVSRRSATRTVRSPPSRSGARLNGSWPTRVSRPRT